MNTRIRLMAIWLMALSTAGALGQAASAGSTAPAASEPNLATGAAIFDEKAKPEIVVKRARTGHLLVKPTVNGIDAGWFIFDSGAGICVISTPHADKFGLQSAGSIEAAGVGGNSSVPLLRAAKIVLGPLTLQDQPLISTDLSFLKQHLEEEIVGVLGFGVLEKCVAELDLATPRIMLHDPGKYTLPTGEWTPVSLVGRVPIVTAKFEGREGRFMLDTGSNETVSFAEPAVRKHKLLEGRTLKDAKMGGVGGFIAAKRGALTSLELGGVRRENVEATFAIEAKGAGADGSREGSIGAEFLSGMTLVLDYAHERIAVRERAQ